METPNIRHARIRAFSLHQNQMYGLVPYCFHLMDVVRILLEYNYDDEELIIAAYFHDAIEDTEITQDELEKIGKKVFKLVHAVSGEGANRKEKKACMLARLSEYPKAIPLKMADRLANMRNCAKGNPRMLKMYVKELPDYEDLFEKHDPAMWSEMMEIANGCRS